ncbi:MAG: biotin--[acetyl-CoA-carboxylase] ligase [Pseudonocardiaceae bacterium]
MWSDLERAPLRTAALRSALVVPHGPYAGIDVRAEAGSTNAELAATPCAPDRTVLVAEHQSAGRGRAGRSWVAPARSGLAVSVLLRPEGVPQARWGWLPLLAGVALCEVVGELGEIEAVLKWPNDLLLGPHGRKGAGILAEVVGRTGVVVGIGLNVTVRAEELPVPEATSLVIERAACTDREGLLRALLRRLDAHERRWREQGGDPAASGLDEAYRRHCATVGRPVRVELPARDPLLGTAVDVDGEGRLVVEVTGQRHALSAGDVTHVRVG